ncbi:MAG: hypothetical protein IPM82_01270 [Saprospiraceae bacterium]|nr:hypothetical protein [Saprospiraceae bacterium]
MAIGYWFLAFGYLLLAVGPNGVITLGGTGLYKMRKWRGCEQMAFGYWHLAFGARDGTVLFKMKKGEGC